MRRSRRELSNGYLLANFGFGTAENEHCKVCPLSVYIIIIITDPPGQALHEGARREASAEAAGCLEDPRVPRYLKLL